MTHALCVSLLSGTTAMLLILHPAYSFRQLCVCTCVVLWLWGCGIAQLRDIIWWLTRAGKTSGLWSSGHAAHPQPANQHHVPEVSKVQRTYGRALWCTCTCRTHRNQVPWTPKTSAFKLESSGLSCSCNFEVQLMDET